MEKAFKNTKGGERRHGMKDFFNKLPDGNESRASLKEIHPRVPKH